MNNEQHQFLNLKTFPARLEACQAGWYLGFAPHDVPILVSAGLLKPLGHPPANGLKYFATAMLEELRRDPQWLARASDARVRYWRVKNGSRSKIEGGNDPKPQLRCRPQEDQPQSDSGVENVIRLPRQGQHSD